MLHEDQERDFIVIDKPGSIVRIQYRAPKVDLNALCFSARSRNRALFLSLSRGDPPAGIRVPEGLQ